jgi:hypothetical protein
MFTYEGKTFMHLENAVKKCIRCTWSRKTRIVKEKGNIVMHPSNAKAAGAFPKAVAPASSWSGPR